MTSTRSSREQRRNNEFRRVFFWQLKANRTLALFYTFFLIIALPVMHMVTAYTSAQYYLDPKYLDPLTTAEDMLNNFSTTMANDLNMKICFCLIPLSVVFLICYGVSAFGFMHTRRSVDLFHALPVRRTPMLMGTFVAGLVYLYLPVIVTLGLCEGIHIYYHIVEPFSGLVIAEAMGLSLLLLTAFYVTCLFFCVVSGTLMDAVISIGAMNLGWPLLVFCVYQTIALTLPGWNYGPSLNILTAFSPIAAVFLPFGRASFEAIFYGMVDGTVKGLPQFYDLNPIYLAWWAGVIVVFLLGSVLYYKRRKSECAEDHFSYPVIRGVLRFLVSAGSGLGMGLLLGGLLDSNFIFLIGIVAGSAIAHVVSQAIWTHSFRRFWLTIPAYLFMLCCVAGFLFVLYTDATGFVHRLPDAEQVAELSLTTTDVIDGSKESYLADTCNMQAVSEEYDYVAEVNPVFTEAEDIQLGVNYQKAITDHYAGPYLPFEHKNGFYHTDLTYELKNGFTFSRTYYIDLDEEKTADIIAAEHEVIACDAFQSCSLFPTMSEKDVANVEISGSSDSCEISAQNETETFTEEERKLVWDTFLEELNSPDFWMDVTYMKEEDMWDEGDVSGEIYTGPTMPVCPEPVPEDRAEMEAYFSDLIYYINFNSKLFEELPRSYQDRIMAKCEVDTKPYYVQGLYCMDVPACCPKTRQLIYDLVRENAEVSDYEAMDDGEAYDDWD